MTDRTRASDADATGSVPLRHGPADIIGGRHVPIPGDGLRSFNPARPSQTVWMGGPVLEHVDLAIAAARRAQREWAASPAADRFALLRAFAEVAKRREAALAGQICDETGKAMWECKAEAALIHQKVEITLDEAPHGGLGRVTPFGFAMSPTRRALCEFRPHGVMAVIGPYNFPAHLPNGHIVPALAAGNTVVFKPSDKAPAVGQMLGQMLVEAGFPAGVINVVQGGAATARRLVAHDGIDGVLFTGSWPVGRAIMEANLDRPGRILALEMGGNNPVVVMPDADMRQAAIEVVRCAFNTTGQRCTSTRRLIVHEAVFDRFLALVRLGAEALEIGDPRSAVFMGPIIRAEARDAVLAFQRDAEAAGGEAVLRSRAMDDPGGARGAEAGFYLTPGVLRAPRFSLSTDAARDCGCDVEVFGPLLRVAAARDLDDAMEQANATRFGLAASIFTRDPAAIERFRREASAGCVNVNTGTAGASSRLPFGGLGHSGNHRPAGSFSLDYCAFPVASMVEESDAAMLPPGMRFDDSWVR